MKIRLARKRLERGSIVDGEGIRAVLWTQGCSHNCLGCHNPETHSFNDGYLLDIEEVKKDIDSLDIEDGITLTGGDPLYQVEAVNEIAKYAKKKGLNVYDISRVESNVSKMEMMKLKFLACILMQQ